MDSGIETIIYIVLGIVFVVAQVLKKKKKQQSVEDIEGQDVEPVTQDTSKGLLEQFLGFDEVEDPFDKPSTKDDSPLETSKPLSTPLSSTEVETEVLSYRQFGDQGKEVQPDREAIEITEDQKRKVKRVQNFDLRKAVIYSVILERKYF